jgi:hypothetical protein
MIITFYGLNLSFMYLPYTTTKMHNKMIPTQIQYSLYISLQFQGEILCLSGKEGNTERPAWGSTK